MGRLLLIIGLLAGVLVGNLRARPGPDVANLLFIVAFCGFVLAFLWILWVRANPPPRYGLGGPSLSADGPPPLPKVQVIRYRGHGQATVLWGELLLPLDRSL